MQSLSAITYRKLLHNFLTTGRGLGCVLRYVTMDFDSLLACDVSSSKQLYCACV